MLLFSRVLPGQQIVIIVKIRLEVPGNDLFVKESAADFEQSIDEAVNKLQTLIRKSKEKMVDRQQGKIKENYLNL